MGDSFQQDKNAIVLGFKRNDTAIMKSVYLSTYPKVRSYILRNSGADDNAKDIFQEAFIACWKNIKENKFSGNGNVEAYLFTIAKNKWTDYLRSRDFRKKSDTGVFSQLAMVVEEPTLDEHKAENERRSLHEALKQLGGNCRMLLKLFYFEKKSMKEIALAMNITPASARNQKYRCMEKLRTLSLAIKENG